MTHEKKGPVTELKEQLEEKAGECKSIQEEYLRALADFDNLRKRTARDSEVSRRLALEALILELLPVLDNFDRAVEAAGMSPTVDGLQKGMGLIHRQLRDVLRKHGVQEYSCVGTQFDPRRAEAISFVHTDEHKPGTVVSEIGKGYTSGERVLRPAKVVVAKEPGPSQRSEVRSQSVEVADGGSQEPKADREDSEAEAGEIAESDSESKD